MKKLLLLFLILAGFEVTAQTTCALATNISANGTITTPAYTTSTFSAGCLSSRTGVKAIWYKYTPASNGEMTISSNLTANNGTTYTDDTRVSVFKGTCAALTCIGSNDDVSATNYLSAITVPVAAGTTYYIQWDNYWGLDATSPNLGLKFTFNFDPTVSCIRLASNDFYLPDTYTTTSANLYWNQAIGAPSNYDTDWSTTFATAAGSGTLVSTSTLVAGNPAYAFTNVSGVPASSNIRYYVRGNCGFTQSEWQGPYYAYMAKTLPYSTTFEDATKNYTDGFIGFSRLTSSATSNPANYADGGAGNSMYTFNSLTAASNRWAYSRAISLAAGEVVSIDFKTRLYTGSTADPMTLDVTVGSAQTATAQSTVLASITETDDTQYNLQTATFTAPTDGIYYFGFHNNSPQGTNQTYLFMDTLNFTSVLSSPQFDNFSFSVTPNPAKDNVLVRNANNIAINAIEMTDINGRIVKTVKFSNVTEAQVTVSDLAQGVYMMKIVSDKGIATKKVVKE